VISLALLWNRKGFTILETLVAAFIFGIVALASWRVFWTMRQGFDLTATHGFVQRTGTALSESIQRDLTMAAALQVVPCGGQTEAEQSVMYTTPMGKTRCIFVRSLSGDPGLQLYKCDLVTWAPGSACTSTPPPQNLLLTLQSLNAPKSLTTSVPEDRTPRIVVSHVKFQRVPCVKTGSEVCSTTDLQVVSSLFNLRFDLDVRVPVGDSPNNPGVIATYIDPNIKFDPNTGKNDDPIAGQRFAVSFATRN